MSQDKPKISVIIPIWNTENYLRKCLRSLVSQTYQNLEIICINNGSTDSCADIIKEFINDKRIVSVYQEHTSLGEARNKGLELATGDYIAFVDSDDWLEPDTYDVNIQPFLNDPEIDLVVYPTQLYSFDGKTYRQKQETYYNFPMRGKHKMFDETIFPNMSRVSWNKIFKASIIKNNNIRYVIDRYHEDAYFFFSYALQARNVYFTDKIAYNYIKHQNSNFKKWMVTDFVKIFNDNFFVLSEIYKMAKSKGYVAEFKSCIYASIMKYLQSPYRELTNAEVKEIITCLKDFAQLAGDDIDDEFIHNIRKRHFYKIKQLKLPRIRWGNRLLGFTLNHNNPPLMILNLLGIKIKWHYKKKMKEIFRKIFGVWKEGSHKVVNILGFKLKFRYYTPPTAPAVTAPNGRFDARRDGRIVATLVQKHMATLLLHQKNFAHYKNFYNGKDVVVCGAGPSLQYYSPLPDCIHVATNRAFLYDKVKFNYIFTQDWVGIEHIQDELANYKGDNCIKFFGTQNGNATEIPEPFAIKCNALRFNTDCEYFPNAKFAVDISTNPFGNFHTIVLTALQFILYTNPRRIYIVGCDSVPSGHFNSQGEDDNEKERQIALQKRFHEGMYNDWLKFKKFTQVYYPETEIISVNPIKLKGLFKDVYTQEFIDANRDNLDFDISNVEILDEKIPILT